MNCKCTCHKDYNEAAQCLGCDHDRDAVRTKELLAAAKAVIVALESRSVASVEVERLKGAIYKIDPNWRLREEI